ncbi:TerC/Alx family metal homeostasis membrane protein [Actinoplanes sp. LDG1-06]|uniref:TerC/Alx family metal homeostasis membrane protein n=1 Tax=Paractinoplanes ovalisporus TaxID=2810368 RepID=A0ABS2A510_9ACTN|nr:TerC/Alx family metal homeostasis membrane protein [Actinoplanes ovalisporus]MBM2614810.1 TerC/Alx family metal homeostasis membrane protein [Actinoplanes ovalisporus]
MAEVTLAAPLQTIGSPLLWTISIAVLIGLLVADFVVTRKPHDVPMREAVGWSVFYLTLPALFGLFLWWVYGSRPAIEFYTGFVVEKSLSVDNLFVFMLLLTAFAVPSALSQRVLLYGIAGALVLRGVFIALGAAVLQAGTWAFLLFGAALLLTAVKVLRDAMRDESHTIDVDQMRSVRVIRRFFPVTKEYHGAKMVIRQAGKRALTPLAVVVVAVFMTDIVFAVDSVPAVYGVTEDPYLVFATNAFALMGLRALYFVLRNVLDKLRHLDYGLAIILAFIGVKLVLHWAHGIWTSLPEVPTLASLGVIAVTLITVTITSLIANKRDEAAARTAAETDPVAVGSPGDDR